jgi:hypothetical protein
VTPLQFIFRRQAERRYALPLQGINVLVGGQSMEAGVIDPGLQIVIRKDLADEVAALVNPRICLEMEAANSVTNWASAAQNISPCKSATSHSLSTGMLTLSNKPLSSPPWLTIPATTPLKFRRQARRLCRHHSAQHL